MIYKILTGGIVSLVFLVAPSAVSAQVLPFPAPTLLVPAAGTPLGQDRVWVGGVAKNNSTVKVFVDGEEKVSAKVRNHRSGTASFGFKLDNLGLGGHKVTATATDPKDKVSAFSNELSLDISVSTPAPTLRRPVVNANSGIERPFVSGNVHNGLTVSVVIDNRIVKSLTPEPHASGVTSFSWQVEKSLALGQHKVEAFASDNGKLSNNSKALWWRVGEKKEEEKKSSKAESPAVKVEPSDSSASLSVREEKDETGRIVAVDEKEGQPADSGVKEVSPGAIVRTAPEAEPQGGFRFNSSLIVGIAILIFLLLSMLVWYIQEKRDSLGEKVTGLFREKEEIGFKSDRLPGEASAKEERDRSKTDLPPPPPPVF